MSMFIQDCRWVFMEMTNRCNFDCTFCPSGISERPKQDMSADLAMTIIDQLQTSGFQGRMFFHILGEPLLHSDVFTIINHAAEAGIRPVLFTNGGTLTEAAVTGILKSRVSEVVISMQTINQPSYEKLRKTPFDWEAYLWRIQRALTMANDSKQNENQCTFQVSMGIKKAETAHPEELYFLEYESLDQIKTSIRHIFGCVGDIDLTDVFSQLDKYGLAQMPMVRITDRLALSVKPMGNWRRIQRENRVETGQCAFFGKELGILSDGAVTYCHLDYDGRTRIGNAAETPLVQLIERPGFQNTVRAFTKDRIVPKGCEYCRAVKNGES